MVNYVCISSGLKPLDIINPVHIYMYLKLLGLQCYFLLTHFPLGIYQKTPFEAGQAIFLSLSSS